MKVSKKSRYGLRAIVNMALSGEEKPISAKTVSDNEGIPLQYLEQIFNILKNRGLVKTTRGPRGGYILSRRPSKIRVKDVIDALEDKSSLVDCLDVKNKSSCDRIGFCATKLFWAKLNRCIDETMSSTTIQDLYDKAKKTKAIRNGIEHHYIFQI